MVQINHTIFKPGFCLQFKENLIIEAKISFMHHSVPLAQWYSTQFHEAQIFYDLCPMAIVNFFS